ncbi:hypothetical protein HK096_007409 [Nowakowskiella sp. JEL0078]|nr:hypothetical protein HK096_007409 [Nowakowskiella sp. JEL0078]
MQDVKILPGEILVANHISYIDIFYLAAKFAPTFVEIGDNGTVSPISTWKAIADVGLTPKKDLKNLNGLSLEELASKLKTSGGGPIVVFPEGTTSNGRGLLKFLPVLNSLDLSKFRIQLIGLKYEFEEFSPSFTVGSKLFHMFGLLSQFGNFLEVKQLPVDEVRETPNNQKIAELSNGEDLVTNKIGTLLSQMLRIRRLGLGRDDKSDFLEYYSENTSRKKIKSK